MSTKKAEVTKVKQAIVKYNDGEGEDELRVVANGSGFDIQGWADTPFVLRLTHVQWKAMKKAVKALKGKKSKKLVEEPAPEQVSEPAPEPVPDGRRDAHRRTSKKD